MGWNGADLGAMDEAFLFKHLKTAAERAWIDPTQRFLQFTEAAC